MGDVIRIKTVMHELGHALGLIDLPFQQGNIMNKGSYAHYSVTEVFDPEQIILEQLWNKENQDQKSNASQNNVPSTEAADYSIQKTPENKFELR